MENTNQPEPQHETARQRHLNALGRFLKSRFNLYGDQAEQAEVVEHIGKGVDFKGVNLWVLIFAAFVASLGLNVNSAAVIIGAMLISPLMGPIMGIGLSLGINDFELMKRSLRNFLFMTLVAIATAMVYFTITPLDTARSELLARTVPTLYDVLIALFGGLAGVVAQTRKDRSASTVIPGVAIATALMPPLCTAGYGLATGQLAYFAGAFYLFFINTVFIALATFLMVRFMKYDKQEFRNRAQALRVNRSMVVIVVVTLVPSVVIGFNIVRQTIFESNADRFVAEVFDYRDTQVIDYTKTYKTRKQPASIELLLIGEPLTEGVLDHARARLESYGLAGTELVVLQPNDPAGKLDVGALNRNYAELLDEKNRRIDDLERRLSHYSVDSLPVASIAREAAVVTENVGALSLYRAVYHTVEGTPADTMLVCIVKPKDAAQPVDREKLAQWLHVRTNTPREHIDVKQDVPQARTEPLIF